jgi:hypothetical protein
MECRYGLLIAFPCDENTVQEMKTGGNRAAVTDVSIMISVCGVDKASSIFRDQLLDGAFSPRHCKSFISKRAARVHKWDVAIKV